MHRKALEHLPRRSRIARERQQHVGGSAREQLFRRFGSELRRRCLVDRTPERERVDDLWGVGARHGKALHQGPLRGVLDLGSEQEHEHARVGVQRQETTEPRCVAPARLGEMARMDGGSVREAAEQALVDLFLRVIAGVDLREATEHPLDARVGTRVRGECRERLVGVAIELQGEREHRLRIGMQLDHPLQQSARLHEVSKAADTDPALGEIEQDVLGHSRIREKVIQPSFVTLGEQYVHDAAKLVGRCVRRARDHVIGLMERQDGTLLRRERGENLSAAVGIEDPGHQRSWLDVGRGDHARILTRALGALGDATRLPSGAHRALDAAVDRCAGEFAYAARMHRTRHAWPMLAAFVVASALAIGCGGAPPRGDGEVATRDTSRTVPPNEQWTADDIALFERIVTGAPGTVIDIDHLTPAQLARAAQAIRRLHAVPHPGGRAERRVLLLWALGPQVHVQLCVSSDPVVPEHADRPYSIELLLALAASIIETSDPVQQQRAGVEGVLVNYQAARAEGADAQPIFEALLAQRAADGLLARATALATCAGPGTLDP